MKRKIIALLMATVCTTAVFASCDEGTSSSSSGAPACETHVDVNKDGLCDGCAKAVVVITEQLPAEKEQEVAMVVNAIPENVKTSDYIGPKTATAEEDTVLPAAATIVDMKGWKESNKNLHLIETTEEERDHSFPGGVMDPWREIAKEVVRVYDASKPAAEAVVFEKKNSVRYNYYKWADNSTDQLAIREFEYSEELDETTTYEVEFKNNYVKVVEIKKEKETNDYGYTSNKYTYKTEYYTYGWNLIATAEETESEGVDATASSYAGYVYLTIEGKTYTLDGETGEKVAFAEVNGVDGDMMLRRPNFDVVVGDYGYVMSSNKIMAYDLTKWISCVSVFDYPSYWNNAKSVVLDNGTVFVQYEKTLHSSAVSYDVKKGDSKIDLVQVLVNPVDGTTKTAEFGYVLDTAKAFDTEKYNDNAKNIVYLYPIAEKEVNYAAGFEAVIDSELKILFAYQPTLVGQDLDSLEYLGNGLYLTEVVYDANVSVRVVVDGEGKEVKKLPNSATKAQDMWKVGTKYYSLDMSKVLFDAADYDEVNFRDGYMILKKVTLDDPATEDENEAKVDYYYFTSAMTAPVLVSGSEDFSAITYNNQQYFIVKLLKSGYNSDGDLALIPYDTLYNENNELVASFKNKQITNVENKGENLWKVTTYDLEKSKTEVVWLAK